MAVSVRISSKNKNNKTMNIKITEESGAVKALFIGRFDTMAATEAAAQFGELSEKADREIVLDFTDLEYISSSGLRLLIGLRKTSAAKGGKVIIEHMNDSIRSVFAMTGFANLFEIR